MLGIENYLGFIAAGIVLNLTPGADTYITRSKSWNLFSTWDNHRRIGSYYFCVIWIINHFS